MTTMTLDPQARLDDDERLLFVTDFEIPANADADEITALGREICDEQILAELVTF